MTLAFPKPKDIRREPEHIHVFLDGRETCNLLTAQGKRIYRERIKEMHERQNGLCCLCGLPLKLEQATFEHEWGKGFGGAHRDDRISIDGRWVNGAAHYLCNSDKGSRRIRYNG